MTRHRLEIDALSKTGRWCMGAVAVLAAAVTLSGCGVSVSLSPSGGRTSTASASYRADLAYAQCMRAHGLTRFPNPSRSGGGSYGAQLTGSPDSPAARADNACKHLLTGGTTTAAAAPSRPAAAVSDCMSASRCYTPRAFRVAYGIRPLLNRGLNGSGITVVLPEQAEPAPARPEPVTDILQSVTDLRQDLAEFDSRFGLPRARIKPIRTLAGSSASPWLAGVEEVEDTELVHAVAPDATIRELLVRRTDVSDPAKFAATFATYVRIAAREGQVISQSGIGQNFNVGEGSWTH